VPKLDLKHVDERVQRVIRDCLSKEVELLELDANERRITHKIAEHLQLVFRELGYDVDCEYNRDGYNTKKLWLRSRSVRNDDSEGDTVFPDIIVHRRGTRNNLVVIEAKKITNGDRSDLEKLKAFKTQLGYKLCYRLIVNVGKGLNRARLYELSRV
jgi:hypothetical protein